MFQFVKCPSDEFVGWLLSYLDILLDCHIYICQLTCWLLGQSVRFIDYKCNPEVLLGSITALLVMYVLCSLDVYVLSLDGCFVC